MAHTKPNSPEWIKERNRLQALNQIPAGDAGAVSDYLHTHPFTNRELHRLREEASRLPPQGNPWGTGRAPHGDTQGG